MKILFVNDLCPISDEEKGLPLTLLNFITDFQKLGHEVTLLRPNVVPNILLRGRRILPEGEFLWHNIKIINKNFLTPFFGENQFKFLKDDKFDVILSHMPSGILAANKISKLLKIPYFAAVHSSDIQVLKSNKYFFLRNLMKDAFKNALGVLSRSFWLKDEILKIMPALKENTEVIPSGIEKEKIINESELQNKFYDKPYKMLSVGSLIKRKNFNSLIKAVSKLENIELTIIGEGPEKDKLQKLSKRLNMDKRIKFIGKKNNEYVLDCMKQAQVFILPSIRETFGMVYLEAMASGCITVCSCNSGVSGYIENNSNGFLTGAKPNEIAETIIKILNSDNLEEIAKRGLNTAKTMERIKMAENYVNIIQKFLV